MKKVYVAGAMNSDNISDMLGNISEGIKIGAGLLSKGYAPFVPHLDIAFKLQQGRDYDVTMEDYYNYTMEYLRSSDLVLVAPNSENSKGTQAEIAEAQKLNIPIYYSIDELIISSCQNSLDNLDFEIIEIFKPKDILKKLTKDELLLIMEGDYIDYWKVANIYCNKIGGTLPTMQQLADLASVLYGTTIEPYKDYIKLNVVSEYKKFLTFGSYYWSSEQYLSNASNAYIRSFNSSYSFYYTNAKGYSNCRAICIRSKNNE